MYFFIIDFKFTVLRIKKLLIIKCNFFCSIKYLKIIFKNIRRILFILIWGIFDDRVCFLINKWLIILGIGKMMMLYSSSILMFIDVV